MLQQYDDELLPESDPTYARVAKVSNRLLSANSDIKEIHGKEWTISVIHSDQRNAFVLPVSLQTFLIIKRKVWQFRIISPSRITYKNSR